jgi:hypothetical protein
LRKHFDRIRLCHLDIDQDSWRRHEHPARGGTPSARPPSMECGSRKTSKRDPHASFVRRGHRGRSTPFHSRAREPPDTRQGRARLTPSRLHAARALAARSACLPHPLPLSPGGEGRSHVRFLTERSPCRTHVVDGSTSPCNELAAARRMRSVCTATCSGFKPRKSHTRSNAGPESRGSLRDSRVA